MARRQSPGVPPLAVDVGGGLALRVEGRLVLRLCLLPDVFDEAVVQVRRLQAVAGGSRRGEAGLEVGGVAELEWKTGVGGAHCFGWSRSGSWPT